MGSNPFRRQYIFAWLAACVVAFLPASAWSQVFDIFDAEVIVEPDFPKGQDFAYYYLRLRVGYNGGNWMGTTSPPGAITSSMAISDPTLSTSVNLVDNAILGVPTFGGAPTTNVSLLLKYTYYGDADLNGQVNADDLTVFGNNFGRLSGVTQIDGDVDFDNDVDADDLTVFGNNFGKGVGNPLSGGTAAAVPEPATFALGLAALAIAALARFSKRFRRA
jgi:hypothetical protein